MGPPPPSDIPRSGRTATATAAAERRSALPAMTPEARPAAVPAERPRLDSTPIAAEIPSQPPATARPAMGSGPRCDPYNPFGEALCVGAPVPRSGSSATANPAPSVQGSTANGVAPSMSVP
jgi:hypothetical protein